MTENEIAKFIEDAANEVYRGLGGPGLPEEFYDEAMAEELKLRNLKVERQLPAWVSYKGRGLSKPLRLGMKVEDLVLVDNKAVPEWNPIYEARMLTYLRLTGAKLGLVINFGDRSIRSGIHRVMNGLPEAVSFKPQLKRKNPKAGQNWRQP
jgi:GxxExxY protein